MNLILSLVLLFLCCVFSLAEILAKKGSKFLCAVLVVLLVFIVAERSFSVPDTHMYLEIFEESARDIDFLQFLQGGLRVETGYIFFNHVVNRLGLNFRVFMALVPLIACTVYLYAMSQLMTLTKQGLKLYCVFFSM